MYYLKEMLVISLVALFPCVIQGQNLLANSDFKDVNTCTEQDARCAPEAWLMTSPHVPIHKDNRVLIVVHNSGKRNVRQYLQTQLLQELKEGETYQLKIRLKAGDCVINSFGVKFEDEFTCFRRDQLIEDPDIDFSNQLADIRKRKQRKWMEFNVAYKARGDEKFILIGCFDSYRDQHRDFKNKPEPYKNFYYYIDQVELIDPALDTLPEQAIRVKKHLYNYDHRHTYCNYLPYSEPESVESPQENREPIRSERVVYAQPDTIIFSDVLFDFNSSKLKEDVTRAISEKVEQIDIDSIKNIEIIGYTDNVGTKIYNENLSKERAISVKEFLISIGVDEKLISADGAGSKNPVADNTTDTGRAQNRRIEIYITYKE